MERKHPLSPEELSSLLREDQGKALEIRLTTLRNQLFEGIRFTYTEGGKFSGAIAPDKLPDDEEIKEYLRAKDTYHEAMRVSGMKVHDFDQQNYHEREGMRARLALGTLEGKNNRGDLLIGALQEILAEQQKGFEEEAYIEGVEALYAARIEYAKRMVEAFQERFGDERKADKLPPRNKIWVKSGKFSGFFFLTVEAPEKRLRSQLLPRRDRLLTSAIRPAY